MLMEKTTYVNCLESYGLGTVHCVIRRHVFVVATIYTAHTFVYQKCINMKNVATIRLNASSPMGKQKMIQFLDDLHMTK